MSTPRWRGTLIYTGTIATIGTVAVARFGPLATTEVAAPPVVSQESSVAATTPAPSTDAAEPADPAAPSADPSPSETAAPSAGSTTSSTVTVAGSVAQTRYGPVQVSVTFDGAQIVDVQELQSPSTHRESAEISARSMPVLAQEVLDAQSAAIDTVSGATYTSEAYRESVQSAIDQVG
ncbi:FMN-binding protein [Sanguibacter antarcticus]|uniref:Uncharacterized protein with FMN-binding domain n=1 Tax=Sanguibacter antarcticus TaxID=372484 RepID=A0A2A9E478_9MICO|nr:FMN-binding protein [Sanguibacter antarcticus]PFG33000.1 uncharacterized protein with FMN-binding domain [Sanguibacter antarcticus]